jgi:predicted dehydrogenase
MTERNQLAAAARAAGLRVSLSELERLLPAWRRYQDLVDAMRAQARLQPDADPP